MTGVQTCALPIFQQLPGVLQSPRLGGRGLPLLPGVGDYRLGKMGVVEVFAGGPGAVVEAQLQAQVW